MMAAKNLKLAMADSAAKATVAGSEMLLKAGQGHNFYNGLFEASQRCPAASGRIAIRLFSLVTQILDSICL